MTKIAMALLKNKNDYSINSVEHALDLLDAICDEGGEARISRLSERMGMNKASVYRLLATFEKRGFVERGDDSVQYRLGMRAYEMGQKLLSRMGMLRKARLNMERLARQCNESVYFIVQRGDEMLLLDMVDSAQQVKIASLTGRRYPLAAATVGRVFRSWGEGAGVDSRRHLEVKIPPLVPAESLDSIRCRGVCIDGTVFGDGVTSVAVPLLDAKGEVAAVLAILGPTYRMTIERIESELIPQLKDAGDAVSAGLGYVGHYLRSKTT